MKKLSNLKRNYVKISNRFFADPNISPEAKGVYGYIVSLPNDWQFSVKNMSKKLGIGEKKLANILKELLAHNFIKKWYYNDSQGYRRLEMCVYDYETRENIDNLPAKKASRIDCVNSANTLNQSTTTDKILPYQKGDLENIPQPTNLQEVDNTITPLNANENPTIPKGQVGSTIYITNKENNITKKESNKKSNKKSLEQNFDFLSYAKQIFENSTTKPQIALELWIEYIQSKEIAVKRKRGKDVEVTKRMVDSDFNALFKLQELGVELEPRIYKAIDMKYQSFWYDSDNIAWKKHGGHFRNNVGHLDYCSVSQDNPLAKICKNLDDL